MADVEIWEYWVVQKKVEAERTHTIVCKKCKKCLMSRKKGLGIGGWISGGVAKGDGRGVDNLLFCS